MFKLKVHLLLPKHIAERKTNDRKSYEKHQATEERKFVVTLDEGKGYPRTLNELWKTVEEEWSKIGMAVQKRRLLLRKIQARAVVKNHGYRIEANRLQKYGIYK
ncbi:hypothetical protein TNCV_1730491 [Trichonephila clavipes]|nr:hypothetical protein TNCV_1730491 [Trichonephila clavipes]